jgi:capsular polysaccharide biosynthesis protein
MSPTETETRRTQKTPTNGTVSRVRAPVSPASSALKRWWWLILGGAIAIAAATYVVSKSVPATYSSAATVAINVSGVDANDTTQGANNYASQYAQMVGATPVLSAASQTLPGNDASGLSGAVTGGTVGGQNLVTVRASGDSPHQAQARATAVTNAFIKYVSRQSRGQRVAFVNNSVSGLAPIDSQIKRISQQLRHTPRELARFQTLQSELTSLETARTVQLSTIATTGASAETSLSLINAAGSGSETAPRPSLYALAALVLALLIIGRLVVYFSPRDLVRR